MTQSAIRNRTAPVALTIAGSDNSAGAGIQADIKTFSALGVYGLTAVTCVVAEVPGKVSAIQPIAPEIVAEQIRLCLRAFPVAALKTGMLYSRDIIAAVCDVLEAEMLRGTERTPLVVDPVMVATSGDPLLQGDAIALYRERLFALATLVTPNLDETAVLLGRSIPDLHALRSAGQELVATFGVAFLLKGGHLRLSPAVDLLFTVDGAVHEFSAPFVPDVSTHGTGCTYAAAIAAGLARGLTLRDAVAEAKRYLSGTLMHFLRWQQGDAATDALHHFAGIWPLSDERQA